MTLDPKRYDLAIKQLQKRLSEQGVEVEKQTQIITVVSETLGNFKKVMADEISGILGDFEVVRSDLADFNKILAEDVMIRGDFLAKDINAATGSFSYWLTGVNIVGDNIIGGTISTDRLIIRDPDTNNGILYEINNGIVDQTELTDEELKRVALDGRILVAESVTADKINVTDLFSQNITVLGDFALGGKGALMYNSETDELMIRASKIAIGTSSVATAKDVADTKNASIVEAYNEFAVSSDDVNEPETWSKDKPEAGENDYIWQRTVSVYGNGEIVHGTAICLTSAGSEGKPGAPGKSAYDIWLEAGNTGTEEDYLASLKGEKGDSIKGDPGVSVESVTRYYLLQSSELEAPSVPTEYPPPEPWVTTEPTYEEESMNSLYMVDHTLFSNGEWSYSDVSLSSSYEAAKSAYNKAQYAEEQIAEQSSYILQTAEEVTMGILAGYTTTSDLETYKKEIENLFSGSEEGFSFEFEQLSQRLSELGNEIVKQEQYIRLIEGEIHIGKSDSPITSVYTNDALEFRFNGQMVARFTNEVLEVRNISAENQVSFWDQWAMRKGDYIEGVGYNLDILWIK